MTRRIAAAIILTLVVFRLGVAWGQTQAEMNNEAYMEYKKADAKLNTAYKQLVAACTGEQRAKVVAAELAWIKYRDANCEAEAFINKGGTIYPLVWNGIATRMTNARTAEMQAFLSEMKSR